MERRSEKHDLINNNMHNHIFMFRWGIGKHARYKLESG